MAKRDRLKELAAERGQSEEWYIDHIVVPKVNVAGQAEAARQLGVSQASISNWLRGKYVMRPMWLKAVTPKEKADIARVAAQVRQEREEQTS